MDAEQTGGGRLSFSVFEVDLRAGELRKHGLRVRLQQQPFQVLAMLLARPGDVVTREELQRTLWPADTFVDFDHGLNKAINKVRDALGDSADAPRFVETVAKRGYRFLADVRTAEAGRAPTDPPAALTTSALVASPEASLDAQTEPPGLPVDSQALPAARPWTIAASLAAVALASIGFWRFHSSVDARPVLRSLAVLPLESLSSDQSQDYFADGMTDELITDLGQISALRVISRTSVMGYKHTRKPLVQIARELNVDAVVEGTVLRSGDEVRITAQLIDGATDRHLWSDSYQGNVRNTLNLQNTVARAIADQVRVNVNPEEQAALRSATVVNPAAYESYLKGRYFWNKRTSNGLTTARAYFDQAIEEDPSYARAYSGLADTYALLGDWQYAVMTPKEALPRAKAAALKALELDGALGEAHNSLAFCLDGFDWDFASAGREFERAIRLNPGYATAHHWYAWHLALMRRFDEALAEMKKAQSLDPLSLVINADLAELLTLAGAYDRSIEQSLKTLELDPGFGLAHNHLGQAYLQKHMNAEAIDELKKAVALSAGGATCVANLARAYVAAGERREAAGLLDDLTHRSSPLHSYASEIAVIHAALGDHDHAMAWLERGAEERFNPGVLLRPGFDPLRSDPRFADLMRRVGLAR
jgi:TolB-like protein/DNA-binding winged helix-turn-helix (wHTH) protein/tetratricopeptide (TPR) repeat protein